MTNIKQFPGNNTPKDVENTNAYTMAEVLFCPTEVQTVPDIATGGQRNHRYAMSMQIAIIPGFEQTPVNQPVILPKSPSKFFTADTLEDLRARVVHELDRAKTPDRLPEMLRKPAPGWKIG